MNASLKASLADAARRGVLWNYRQGRKYRMPFEASYEVRDSWARYLAQKMAEGQSIADVRAYALVGYKAAQALHEEVCRRSGVGYKAPFTEYWRRGRLAA